jgi:putative ABC transport system permease protein
LLKVAVKGLVTRRLRAVLTALAIVLGVALVAGTYVLTDSLHSDLGSVYQTIYKNTAASITGRNAIDTGANAANGGDVPTFPETLLARVQRLPGVAEASGSVSGTAQLVLNGKTVSFGSSPTLGSSVDPSAPQLSSLKLVSGHWPGATGLVVDTNTASKKHLKVGQRIGVQADGPALHLTISGIVKFGSASSLGGTTLTGFTLATAQRLFSKPGQLDAINVAAKSGTSPQQLVDQIKPILPRDAQVRTGAQQAQTDTNSLDNSLGFLNTLLLAFAGIALFVGAFVIANSLSITIAQRTREFATLRTLGASRRQVLRSVLAESLIIGVFASILGLVVGIFLAKGLFALFNAVGLSLPNGGTVLKSRTIIVSLVVGIVVTMLASLRPALRATRVEPIAAVREGATLPPGRFARFRTAGSAVVIALGFLLIVLGLFVAHGTGPVLALMGAGAILVFIGLSLLSARFVPGMALWIGWPATLIAGAIGRLARDNAMRNPQRTASTASALMIGLALVTLVSIMAAGIISNFKSSVNAQFGGDYAIVAQNNFSPIPTSAGAAAARAPGVIAVGNVRAGEDKVFGSTDNLTGASPGVSQTITSNWIHGSQRTFVTLGSSGAVVPKNFAKKHDLSVGSPVTILTPTGGRATFRVHGIFDPPNGNSAFGNVTISAARFDQLYPQPQNVFSIVKMRGGETAANRAALRRALAGFPGAKVQTRQQFINGQISGLSSVLNILYVLLGLSIIISLFGIVNTLVLSVFERTREIGMLRAVGTSRRQIRRMIRHESVITALIGSVLGIVLGIAFGALLCARVSQISFTIPVGRLIVFLIASWIVGLIAAIFPARRASRLSPLQALAYE